MSKLKLSALLLGAALFLSLGTTSLLAESKCGAGKCGSSEKSENSCDKKCEKDCEKGVKCKHGDKCDCKAKAATTTKCSGDNKPASTMKCGTGKCGSN